MFKVVAASVHGTARTQTKQSVGIWRIRYLLNGSLKAVEIWQLRTMLICKVLMNHEAYKSFDVLPRTCRPTTTLGAGYYEQLKGSVKEPNISIYFFFPPITPWCIISDVLLTGGRGVSDFSVLKYY